MTTLPTPRYTGANCFSAEDSLGNIFYAYQATGADAGLLVMRDSATGALRDITPAPVGGRPCLDCVPHVGLWFVGNKETGSIQPPPRYPIKEYVPWPVGAGPQGSAGPKGDPGAPGAGGPALFPAPYVSAAWAGRVLAGGVSVDIPAAFGCASAPAYLVRLSGQAGTAGVVVRVGTPSAPYFFTLTTQVANVRMDDQGWIPGPVCWVSVLGSALVWLQVIGK